MPDRSAAEIPPLTDADLAAIAEGKDWRNVTCAACGRAFIAEPHLTVMACSCTYQRQFRSVVPSPYDIAPPAMTPTGPRALTRAVDELLDKRALLRELVYEEGCPWREDTRGLFVCVFCDGRGIELVKRHPDDHRPDQSKFEHKPDCIWPRLVAAAGPR